MTLRQFIKGSTDPKAMMPGCSNYNGGCLLGDACEVEQGKRCSYFEDAVLPTASQLKDGSKIVDEYQRNCCGTKLIGIHITKANFCACGTTILKGHRYCDVCKKKNRQKTKREYQKKFRISKRSTVEQKQAS